MITFTQNQLTLALLKAVDRLKMEGFVNSFVCDRHGIRCVQTGQYLDTESMTFLRYRNIPENAAIPDNVDVSIFAVCDGKGSRGIIIDSELQFQDADLWPYLLKYQL